MKYTDIHIHAIYGVDDGAKTESEMQYMVDASYADGVRTMCVTPHYHPGFFGDNRKDIDTAFSALVQYTGRKYPDLEICMGSELRYSPGCVSWLNSGQCRTLNGTQYVLVDFPEKAERQLIIGGLEYLLSAGYRPVLAHAERYKRLDSKDVRVLRADGIIVQIDTQSVFGNFGIGAQRRCKRLLSEGLADIAATDAHNTTERPPTVSNFYAYALKRYGSQYADNLCRYNALKILNDNPVGKDNE